MDVTHSTQVQLKLHQVHYQFNDTQCVKVNIFITIFHYTGLRCERKLTPCEAEPCYNNATCRNVGESRVCLCSAGYTG